MTKAKRAMKEDIKLIDLIIELVDARVPLSSRNPDIDDIGAGKARLILLNKSDLADERCNLKVGRLLPGEGVLRGKGKLQERSGSKGDKRRRTGSV